MKITVIGRKCTPRDSFKERAEKRLKKVEKFFGSDAEAKITATVEKNEQIVEDKVGRNRNDARNHREQSFACFSKG